VSQQNPGSDVLLGVSFTDASNGTAVGQAGTNLRTTDGGQNWVRQESATNRDLYGLSFTDTNTGTAVGAYGAILRTTESGPTPTPTATPTPTPGEITLRASGHRVRGMHTVDLSWTGATSANVDIFRDGSLVATVPNGGTYTDSIGVRGGNVRYTYKVCEAGTQTCSNEVTVRFGGPPV
jgi:photosynthesis system II assembly factor YCF48-like protein